MRGHPNATYLDKLLQDKYIENLEPEASQLRLTIAWCWLGTWSNANQPID